MQCKFDFSFHCHVLVGDGSIASLQSLKKFNENQIEAYYAAFTASTCRTAASVQLSSSFFLLLLVLLSPFSECCAATLRLPRFSFSYHHNHHLGGRTAASTTSTAFPMPSLTTSWSSACMLHTLFPIKVVVGSAGRLLRCGCSFTNILQNSM